MSEVKKISPVGNIYGWEESQFGEFVLSQDYDDLAEEAQALREEVAKLRARVVVLPDASTVYAALDARERLFTSPENIRVALEAQSRINGKTVSKGLLRRISDLFPADMGDDGSGRAGWFPHVRETVAELRALLNQDKENGDHAA
ncbi:hypothetical protein [Pseudomonas aeruginosa]|uniref:hypothetical protein n=1 Tax=Pseudomonas aeruginosa TaxID=287 RepID=UPI002D7934CA|nr:hypothetical protein [Pseudomonas aeruginosa]WRS36984.1 hypothetical protein U9S62_13210 [Pseudomonas aeruginosa]